MRSQPKLRPSVTIEDVRLMCLALDCYIQQRAPLATTNANQKELMNLIKLRHYFGEFKENTPVKSEEDIIKAYLARQAIMQSGTVETLASVLPDSPSIEDSVSYESPIDNPAFSDDQKYELLKLKKEKDYTEQEKIWMLNKGTMIMIQRQANKPISAGEL